MKNTENYLVEHKWQKDWLKMVSTSEFKNLNILVINDFQHAVMLAKDNNVCYITSDPRAAERFQKSVVDNVHFGKDDTVSLCPNNMKFDKYIEKKLKEFRHEV